MQSSVASYHTCVYSAQKTANAVLTSLDLIVGSGDTVSNKQYFPNQDMELRQLLAFGTALGAVRVSTPKLRSVAPLDVYPFVVGSAIPTNANIADMSRNPVQLFATEPIDVQTSESAGGTPTHWAILNLGVRQPRRSAGPRYRIIGTASVAVPANAWTTCPLTYNVNLPHGVYEIQSITPISANGVAARLIVPGEYYRPGAPCLNSVGDRLPWPFYDSNLGNLGHFDTRAYPQIEWLSRAADTSQTVYMDLCKIQ